MAQQTSIPPIDELENPVECRHHWVIQAATGPMSQGICQLCGLIREFKNYVEAATWGDTRLARRAAAADAKVVVEPVSDAHEEGLEV